MTRGDTAEPARTTGGTSLKFLVFANRNAGSVDRDTVGAAVCVLAERGSVELRWSEGSDEVASAVAQRADAVPVVVGGDGTISSSVEALIEADLGHVPLGIVPSGTGNDFARAARIPLDPVEAAEAVLAGSPRVLSALTVTTGPDGERRHGVNALHVGIGAAASRAASDWKSRLGPLAYPAAAVTTGVRAETARLELSTDGAGFSGGQPGSGGGPGGAGRSSPVTSMVAVMLGASIGGGMQVAGDASIDGSTAEVLRATGDGIADRVRLARALLSSEPGGVEGISLSRAGRIGVRCDRAVPVNLDGDDLGDHTEVDIEVVPRAWTMLAGPAVAV